MSHTLTLTLTQTHHTVKKCNKIQQLLLTFVSSKEDLYFRSEPKTRYDLDISLAISCNFMKTD